MIQSVQLFQKYLFLFQFEIKKSKRKFNKKGVIICRYQL